METIYIYEKKLEELNLNLDKDTNILIFNSCFEKFNINVLDNVKINISEFNKSIISNTIININIKSNSELIFNLSSLVSNNHNLIFNISYEGEYSKVKTNIHSIVDGNLYIKLNGVIKNEYKNNELLESVKVLLRKNGKCEVEPYMQVSTKEIIANHLVGISPIRQAELKYLMSKCLSRKSAEKLIYKSFILSNIKNEELNRKIQEYL